MTDEVRDGAAADVEGNAARPSARIYAFPVRRKEPAKAAAPAPAISYGNWYHDEAIAEETSAPVTNIRR